MILLRIALQGQMGNHLLDEHTRRLLAAAGLMSMAASADGFVASPNRKYCGSDFARNTEAVEAITRDYSKSASALRDALRELHDRGLSFSQWVRDAVFVLQCLQGAALRLLEQGADEAATDVEDLLKITLAAIEWNHNALSPYPSSLVPLLANLQQWQAFYHNFGIVHYMPLSLAWATKIREGTGMPTDAAGAESLIERAYSLLDAAEEANASCRAAERLTDILEIVHGNLVAYAAVQRLLQWASARLQNAGQQLSPDAQTELQVTEERRVVCIETLDSIGLKFITQPLTHLLLAGKGMSISEAVTNLIREATSRIPHYPDRLTQMWRGIAEWAEPLGWIPYSEEAGKVSGMLWQEARQRFRSLFTDEEPVVFNSLGLHRTFMRFPDPLSGEYGPTDRDLSLEEFQQLIQEWPTFLKSISKKESQAAWERAQRFMEIGYITGAHRALDVVIRLGDSELARLAAMKLAELPAEDGCV